MSDRDAWFGAQFAAGRVMVILRGLGVRATVRLARRAWSAGIQTVAVPLQRPQDDDSLTAVAVGAAAASLRVRADVGTIIRPAQIAVAARAGAAFTVRPGTDEAIIRAALDAGLPTLPGVDTATDIRNCATFGLSWLKVFPAGVLGHAWLTTMRDPFPDLHFIAVGGVTTANGPALLDAGARVLASAQPRPNPTSSPHSHT